MSLKLQSLTQVAEKEEEGAWVTVTLPNNSPFYMGNQRERPLRIRVAGSHSRTYRRAMKRVIGQQPQDERVTSAHPDDADYVRDLLILAQVTREWDACLDDDGNAIPLTPDNAFVLYEAGSFIADQAWRESRNYTRFFPNASPSQ